MINKDSIVTAYDEHLTLVEWLQKVENALNNAVLTNLGIAKLGDKGNVATYQVTATFADNTTIASNAFTLPSTDIVTAFGNLTTLVNSFDTRITDNTNNVASILHLIDIDNAKINPDTLQNSINGSDDVIVDVDNDKLEIHLSDELQAKLARVLLTPSSAPSTRKVVTIDTNGAQDNVDGTELTTLMSNIVDSHGNKRFVEGDINLSPDFSNLGITKLYGKWSLSGTHLMIVIAINIPANITTPKNGTICEIQFPNYIKDKLIGLWGNILDVKNFMVRDATAWYLNIKTLTDVQSVIFSNGRFIILTSGATITTEAQSVCRIQFDLLIDSE